MYYVHMYMYIVHTYICMQVCSFSVMFVLLFCEIFKKIEGIGQIVSPLTSPIHLHNNIGNIGKEFKLANWQF